MVMDDLYAEGFPTDWDDTVDELLTRPLTARAGASFSNVETAPLISEETLASALQTIYSEHFDPEGDIEPHLLRDIARQLMQAATEGYATPDPSPDGREFLRRLRTDAATFSAFKVHRLQNDMAARLIGEDGNLKPFEQWSNDVRTIADHQCRHWLRTEYNTAVRRAHEAAEWQRFEAEADALPCLRWMPSTSAQPGADHRQFWGTVLPVGHPFWDSHRPGDRWNCKCSLEQTDDEPTAPPAASDDKPQDRPAPGLDTRPDREAQLFSPSHPYYRNAYRGAAQAARKAVDALMREMDEQEQLTAARQTYERLKADPDYTDVKFDEKTGGVKATHVGHINHVEPNAERFFAEGLTGSDLERQCQDQLFRMGHTAILRDEQQKTPNGDYLPALDLKLDGRLMDIRSITSDKPYYGSALRAKNGQLGRYNHAFNTREDSVCLFFYDASMFSEEKVQNGINYLKNVTREDNGEPITIHIKTVYCVVNGKKEIIKFEL